MAERTNPTTALRLGSHHFDWGKRTYIMGIINVTPDSFSGDGLASTEDMTDAALQQARRFAAEGADFLDIGGESTRPGATPITVQEELQRVLPAVTAIAKSVPLPISVDTYHGAVAAAALNAGASIINDIWGLRQEDGSWNMTLARLVAARDVPIIIMHNRRAVPYTSTLGGHYRHMVYDNLVQDVLTGLQDSVTFAESQGIRREHIIVDPGFGFGKTPEQNLELFRHLSAFQSLGLPLLLGTSRKSFIGYASGDLLPQERDEGTVATTVLGIAAGVDIVRVHNVLQNARAARMADAILRPPFVLP